MGIAKGARDLDTTRERLLRWARAHHPEATDLRLAPLTRPAAGLSSETLFVDVSWTAGDDERHEALVARLPPAGDGLFPRYDLARQAHLQELLGPAGIPVAEPVALEEDAAWLGEPFLLMRRVPGRVLTSDPPFLRAGWLHDATPEQQARLHRGFLEVVAAIHRLDWKARGFGFVAPRPGLSAELASWSEYLTWAADGTPPPEITDALDWCRANRPAPEPPASLLWGDVQLANAVFDDSMQTAAVLDWEMASIGPAEVDLGWFLALHRMTAEACGADLPGFPDRAATVTCYRQQLGRELADIRWFEIFALVRSGAIMVRVARLLADAGADGGWLAAGNPALALLRRLVR